MVYVSAKTVNHFRVTDRAYLVGGGSKWRRYFVVDVGNYGRTNAELLIIEWGFASFPTAQQQLPATPRYTGIYHYRDTFGPGMHKRGLIAIVIPDDVVNPVIFGQFTYRDMGKNRLISRFIHDLRENAGPGAPVPDAPDSYTYWD
jgi:hypothetical protein